MSVKIPYEHFFPIFFKVPDFPPPNFKGTLELSRKMEILLQILKILFKVLTEYSAYFSTRRHFFFNRSDK